MKIYDKVKSFFGADASAPSGAFSTKGEGSIVDDILNFNYMMMFPHFTGFYEAGKKNIESVFGEHWDEAQKKKFANQGRLPVNIPSMFPKVLTMLGMEKQNRKQFEGSAQGQEDELTTEFINKIFRWNENRNDPKLYQYTKSDAYQDGLVSQYGVVEIYVETDDFKRSIIKFRQIPYNELLFDLNFRDYEMTTCRRWQRHYFKYIEELIKEHPDKEAELKLIEEDFADAERFPLQPAVNTYYQSDEHYPERKLVRVIEDYKKVNRKVWKIHNLVDKTVFETTSREEADDAMKEIESQLPEGAKIDDFLMMEEDTVEQIEKTKIAGTRVIEEPHILDVPDECPFTFYFSLFIAGKWYTPVGILHSVQQYIDRLFSQLDYSIGIDAKGGAELDVNLLSETHNTIEEVKVAYTEGGLVFKDGQGRLLTPIERSGTNPQFFTVFEMFFSLLEDGFGGRNIQGASESPNQSGKAIGKLLQVANIMTSNYLDNLDRFDLLMGRKVFKYMQRYYDYEMSIKIAGEAFEEKMMATLKENQLYNPSDVREGEGWLLYSPNHPKLKPIKDVDMTIIVNKVTARIDEAEMTRESLLAMKELGYSIPLDSLLNTLPLKPTEKQSIVAYNQKIEEENKQLALQQAKFEALDRMAKNTIQAGNTVANLGNSATNVVPNNQTE